MSVVNVILNLFILYIIINIYIYFIYFLFYLFFFWGGDFHESKRNGNPFEVGRISYLVIVLFLLNKGRMLC